MTDEHAPSTSRRRLVMITVSEYDGSAAQQSVFRAGISAQVAVVEDWWANPGLEEQRRFCVSRPPKPLHSVHDLRAFLIDEDLIDADDEEALVVYITGHGLSPQGGQHFLRLPDTYIDRPLATAFPTAELVTAVLDSRAGHVLVMVDSCFSGRLADDINRAVKALHPQRRSLDSLVVLTAGNEDSTPRLRAFTSALAAVHAHCTDEANGYARSHLSWEEFHTILREVWDHADMADILTLWPPATTSNSLAHRELSPCLPNPGYTDTTVLEDSRSQVGWTRTELDDYWITRASGRMSGAAGWHFTGRTALIAEINTFLAGSAGALIVTGQAGSGKSALLARLVTLSDPRFRSDPAYRPYVDEIPADLQVPSGAVDAAVLARNSDPQELSAALYQALFGQAVPSGQDALQQLPLRVLAAFRDTGRPVTVVVDGIDEAKNPRRIITDVLRPLASQHAGEAPVARLVLGLRSSPPPGQRRRVPSDETEQDLLGLLQRATGADVALRTDDDSAEGDIAAYAAALLRTDSPQGSRLVDRSDEAIAHVADAIAAEVTPSFLDARLAVQQLHGRTHLPRPSDPYWRGQLRQGTQELLRHDLADVAEHSRSRPEDLLAVLRATAFALGAGLPWSQVWPAAVRGLQPTCADPEMCIRMVRDSRLTGYLATAVEDGRTVYRPIHERVSETLRTEPHALLPDGTPASLEDHDADTQHSLAHEQLTKAFTRLLADAPHRPPHPYLRRHLIDHAFSGGVLDDTHIPASFLPFESRGRVRGTLQLPLTARPGTRRLAAWGRIEPFLDDALPAARADSLAMAERADTDGLGPAADSTPRVPALRPRWSRLRLPTNILASPGSSIYKLITFQTADGSTIAAAGHGDGSVTLWDARTGLPFGTPFTGLGPYVRATAVIQSHGGRDDPLLAFGSDAGLWLCDPDTGHTAQVMPGRIRDIVSFFSYQHGRVLAVATSESVLLLDPHGGVISERPHDRERRPHVVHALEAIALPDGRCLLAVGHDGNRVPLMDADTLEPTGELRAPGTGTSALQAFTTVNGEPRLAVAARTGKGVQIYDPVAGRMLLDDPIRQSVSSMAVHAGGNDQPMLVLGSGVDGTITVIDAATGTQVSTLPVEHTKMVRGLAVLPVGFPPQVLSGSLDGTIRVWDLWRDSSWRRPDTDLAAEHIALLPQPAGPPRLISASSAGTIREHTLTTGYPSVLLTRDGRRREITGLTTMPGPTHGQVPALAVAYSDASLHLLTDDGSRHVLFQRYDYGPTRIRALTFLPATAQHPAHLVAAFSNNRLVLYEAGGTYRQLDVANGSVHALAAATGSSGQHLLAVAAKSVEVTHPGHRPHARLPQRIGTVRSLAFITIPGTTEPLLITGGADGSVRTWDLSNPRQEALPAARGHRGPVSALMPLHHPDHPHPLLISASTQDTTIRVWDIHEGQEILRLVTGAPITALTVLPHVDEQDHQPTVIFGSARGIAAAAIHL